MVKIVDHKIVNDAYLYLVSYDDLPLGDEWCPLDELVIHYRNWLELIDDYFDREDDNNDFDIESDI